jgi:membrane fusion protein (multidrug efflux system)
VRVSIPEKDFLEYSRRGAERRASGAPPLKFEMVLSDGSVYPEKGDLVFVDRAVDAQTGTILVEVAFPNPGATVRPGQFARVRVAIDEKKGAILVSQRSVSELQGVYNVAVVKPDDTVELRMVKAAERIGNLWVIDSGLKPGERVVVEGVQKVRAGTKVTPVATEMESAPLRPLKQRRRAPTRRSPWRASSSAGPSSPSSSRSSRSCSGSTACAACPSSSTRSWRLPPSASRPPIRAPPPWPWSSRWPRPSSRR